MKSTASSARNRHIAAWGVLAVGLVSLWRVQRSIDRARSRIPSPSEILIIPSGRLLKTMCLGYDGLMADIYWTRAVQYFGRKRIEQAQRMELLGPLLQATTLLDPHLLIAYRFGAIFLAEKPPMGAGHPDEALQLLRRGIVANPDYWRLWQDLGFVYYWDLQDFPAAARAFKAGSTRPGALVWMKVLAASVAAKGGEFDTSRLLWEQIYLHAENEQIRKSALDHLMALQTALDLRRLDAALGRFRKEFGRAPASFDDLVRAHYLRHWPVDPLGAPYAIGKNGEAELSPKSKIDLKLAGIAP